MSVDQRNRSGQGSSTHQEPIIISDELETGKDVVSSYAKSIITASEYVLTVDRTSKDNMWSVLGFYKGAVKNEDKLIKELVIQFSGEAGADAGALHRELFEDAIKEANRRLFDGEDDCRIPKKEWNL